MTQRLTVTEAAQLAKISPSTWRAYVARGQAPEADGKFGRTPYWNASTVRRWLKSRPSALLVLAFLAVALLTACGAADDATLPVAERTAVAGAPVAETPTASPDVDLSQPGAAREIKRRVAAGECFSISFGSSAVEWSEHMAGRPENPDGSEWEAAMTAWVTSLPMGCDDVDQTAMGRYLD